MHLAESLLLNTLLYFLFCEDTCANLLPFLFNLYAPYVNTDANIYSKCIKNNDPDDMPTMHMY